MSTPTFRESKAFQPHSPRLGTLQPRILQQDFRIEVPGQPQHQEGVSTVDRAPVIGVRSRSSSNERISHLMTLLGYGCHVTARRIGSPEQALKHGIR